MHFYKRIYGVFIMFQYNTLPIGKIGYELINADCAQLNFELNPKGGRNFTGNGQKGIGWQINQQFQKRNYLETYN